LILDLDASYMRSYSPNVMPNPTNIFAWSGTGNNNCTLSGDTAITRQYGSIPLKMVMTGTDPYVGSYNSSIWNLAPAASGQTWTLSFYAKGSETLTGNCYIFGANSGGGYIEAAATSFTVTTSWQRFTFTTTLGNASTAFIQMRFGGSSGQVGKTIWWDGVQVERASSATTFNPYYIGNTTWRDVSGNINNGSFGPSTQTPTFTNSNGGAIVFDGSNDFVEVTSNLGILNQYTIMFWARRDAESRMPVAARTSTNFYWFGDNSWYYTHGGVSGEYYYSKPTSIPLGSWGCYCVVYNGANVSIYRQGIYQGQQSTNGSANWSAGMIIGYWAGGSTYAWQGPISIVMMYNRALNVSEVVQNYEATKTRFGL
jgi:hypothetical protein